MTANIGEPSVAKDISSLGFRVRQLERRPPPRKAQFDIKLASDTQTVAQDAGVFRFAIPADLEGSRLVRAEAYVTTAGSDDVEIELSNETQGGIGLLDDSIVIDTGDMTSYTSSSPSAVDTDNPPFETGDIIWVNIENDGDDALGHGVILDFA
jgi:hypothetical protein